jgi:hypothetical protein
MAVIGPDIVTPPVTPTRPTTTPTPPPAQTAAAAPTTAPTGPQPLNTSGTLGTNYNYVT